MKVFVKDIKALVNRMTHLSVYALCRGKETVELAQVLKILIKQEKTSDSLDRIIDSYFNGNSAVLVFIKKNKNLSDEKLGLALYYLNFYTNNYPGGTISTLLTIDSVQQLIDLLSDYNIPLNSTINKSCKHSTLLRNELNRQEININVCLEQLKLGALPEVKDRRGDTFLHSLLSNRGKLTRCITNTEQNFAVEYRDNLDRTPLHHLLDIYFTLKEVELLIKLGSDPDTLNSKGKSFLYLSMDSDRCSTVADAIQLGCNYLQRYKQQNALQYWLNSYYPRTFDALTLLEKGFDPLTSSSSNQNILHRMMTKTRDLASFSQIQQAINAGVVVYQVDSSGVTPFDLLLNNYDRHSAEDFFAIAKQFIEKLEDEETKSIWGNRILLNISWRTFKPSFSFKPVLELAPDVNYRDDSGNTALLIMAKNSSLTFEHIKEFFEAGADLNAVNKAGNNFLHLLIPNNYGQCLSRAAELGININHKNHDGETPLIMLAKKRSSSFAPIKKLVKAGADVNAVDEFGNNILHLFITNNNIRYLSLAADFGVNANHRNNHHLTPYDLFLKKSYDKQLFPIKLIPDNAINPVNIENKERIKINKAINFNTRLWFLGGDKTTKFAQEGSAVEFQHNSGL